MTLAVVLQIVGAVLVVVFVGSVAGVAYGVGATGVITFAAGYARERAGDVRQ